jgi:murein L,D-transpeptidase YcbB/YkuD
VGSSTTAEERRQEDVSPAVAAALEQLLRDKLQGQTFPSPDWAALTSGQKYGDLAASLLQETVPRDWLTQADGRLSATGKMMWEALAGAGAHGLDPSGYGLAGVADAIAALGAVRGAVPELGEAERAELSALLARAGRAAETPTKLAAELLEGSLAPQFPQARALLQRCESARLERAAAASRVEAKLLHAWLVFAAELSLANAHHRAEEAGVDAATFARKELSAHIARLAKPGARVQDEILGLAPQNEQYPRLMASFARYRQYCAQGAWVAPEKGPKLSVEAGSTGPRVEALRKRLEREGYPVGVGPAAEYDAALAAAVSRYQSHHQLEPTGVVDDKTIESLEVPCTERVAQIAVTLQKWRESRLLDPKGRHVFVNLADFHGELWDRGSRVHRFKVVVGKNRFTKLRDGSKNFAHATPELSSPMKTVIFNPYWYVPESIRTHEIEPEISKDPEYLDKNNMEIVDMPDGTNVVRQRPGPGNALGRVKFLFPNPHDVYLHDTPSKKLFKQPVRAFSHGCMRVENPMELAEKILGLEGRWQSRFKFPRPEEEAVTLRDPLQVVVEYYTVRVDDEGWTHFNTDVYLRDEPRFDAWLSLHPTGQPTFVPPNLP